MAEFQSAVEMIMGDLELTLNTRVHIPTVKTADNRALRIGNKCCEDIYLSNQPVFGIIRDCIKWGSYLHAIHDHDGYPLPWQRHLSRCIIRVKYRKIADIAFWSGIQDQT